MAEYRIEVKALLPDEGSGFLAWVPDLPGCMSDGETAESAAGNCREAIAEWIDHARRCGERIPLPSSQAFA